MGSTRLGLGIVSCALGALSCVFTTSVRAEPAPRKPTVIAGSGTTFGGLFSASSAGAVVELPSRTRLTVAPNATLRIFTLPQLLALTPGPRTWTWSFTLKSGRVDVELPTIGRNAVLATIGKLSGVVTAGHVAFRVQDDEASAVNVDGQLRTLLGSHWQTVPTGFLATLSKEDPNALAKPGVAAPMLLGGQRLWLSPGASVAMHGFHWAAVPGAKDYDLRLRRVSDGLLVDQRRTSSTELPEALRSVEPGKYALALRSIDARGMEGAWAPEADVRVIGVQLPPGGYSTDRAIFLAPGQQVRFTNTDGLEMTYAGAGCYFPATQGAKLHHGQSTLLGFRMPGALETAVARLEPRAVYAEVTMGPSRALWPRDPISIDIRLQSREGVEVPPFLQLIPKVTVGTDEAPVSFENAGGVLHAVLPPSDVPGPWVVRVDVTDQFGVALGHDFLEVAKDSRVRKVVTAPASPVRSQPPLAPNSPTASRSAGEPSVASRD